MNSKFTSYMIDQLRALVNQLEGARQPVNEELYEVITAILRTQYEADGE